MWGYREVPVPEYDPCPCPCGQKGVSDISGLKFDSESGVLSMSFVRDGKMEELTTKIGSIPSMNSVTDITSMKLNKDNTLTLSFVKADEKKEISVNLDKLEDDIFIEDLGDNLI